MGDEPQGQETGTGGNPAWNDFLQYVPEEKHGEVTPLLQQWDRGVQERFEKVHQENKPWEPVIKSGVDPETVQFGIELLSTLQTDPRKVFDALAENYGWKVAEEVAGSPDGGSSGQGQQITADDLANLTPEQFQELAKRQDIVEQILIKQREDQLLAAEEKALDDALNNLRDKYGDYDEEDVVRRLAADDDLTPEDAYKQSVEYADRIRTTRPVAPKIAGGGSGMIPAATVDVSKLSDKDTRALVAKSIQDQIMAQGG